MAEPLKSLKDVDEFWRDVSAKILVELKRRGVDVDAMSDAEFAGLCEGLAQHRPNIAQGRRNHRAPGVSPATYQY